ncbi:hypothetical protein BX070DRAFT_255687 [Coemansia spiralis]|nr:hypothetical protein BX070DRAFT_255687 [Coemansia spiralis]
MASPLSPLQSLPPYSVKSIIKYICSYSSQFNSDNEDMSSSKYVSYLKYANVYIANGTALECMHAYGHVEQQFPNARNIEIVLLEPNEEWDYKSITFEHATNNAKTLVKYIRKMAMGINSTTAILAVYQSSFRKYAWEYVYPALELLFQGTKINNLVFLFPYKLDSEITGKPSALSFYSFCLANNTSDCTIEILHRNASTLIELVVSIGNAKKYNEFGQLFIDGKGDTITYDYVKTFNIDSALSAAYLTGYKPVFPGLAPFPIATKIKIGIVYPFGDDVVFRGKTSQLEYLRIGVDYNAMAMFRYFGTFRVEKNRPQYLELGATRLVNEIEPPDEFIDEYNNLGYNLLQRACMVKLSSMVMIESALTGLLTDRLYTNMQSLDIGNYKAELGEVISVLRTMPRLGFLKSGVRDGGHLMDNVSLELLPNFFSQIVRPTVVSCCLSTWRLPDNAVSAQKYRDQVMRLLPSDSALAKSQFTDTERVQLIKLLLSGTKNKYSWKSFGKGNSKLKGTNALKYVRNRAE